MRVGKGTQEFENYVRNLQDAILAVSIGSQLAGERSAQRYRRAMIHNPYMITVAEMGLYKIRAPREQALSR